MQILAFASKPLSTFVLLTFISFGALPLNAQVEMDWSKAHPDTRIDFIAWYAQKASATVNSSNQFNIRILPDHGDVIINYLNYDGSKWTARLNGDKFVHAPNGDFGLAHEDARMDYIQSDGANCSATITGDAFAVVNHRTNTTFVSKRIYFKTWNRANWTALLAKPTFTYWPGTVENDYYTSSSISYLSANSTRWTATILPNGSFRHTDENGKSHDDKYIVYLNYDGSMWGASFDLATRTFRHAPGHFVQAPPANPGPGTLHYDGVFTGIPVEETNGILSYRPVNNNICSDNLASFPTNRIVLRSRSGRCFNLGQWRDIYMYYYKK
jgi:hypothetical protein